MDVQVRVEIYDLSGRKVISAFTDSGSRIPVSSLSEGIYSYIVLQGKERYEGKFVVQ